MMGARGARGLFKGITLSDAEKANLKAVREKYATQQKALREQFKPQMQAAREARQKGDTAALRDLWQKSAGQREQAKQLMLAERNDLRSALTPANQATFDTNVAALQKRTCRAGTERRKARTSASAGSRASITRSAGNRRECERSYGWVLSLRRSDGTTV
jgi:protein CpxP